MRTAAATLLALLALPALAKQRRHTLLVRAVVVRAARIHAGHSRLELAGRGTVLVAIDGAAPRLATGDVPLPPGTLRVTIQY